MKRLHRSFSKSRENSCVSNDIKNIEKFYRMLLKFEKRHPDFNAKKLIQKLYPTFDVESIL
jgi:inorganic pyrophosphatase/exopolyphosphatase